MKKSTIIIISIVAAVVVLTTVGLGIYCGLTVGKDKNNEGYYLLCYFTGNSPEQERVCFATSDDGYEFISLKGGLPMIKQELGTGCSRDPFVFRANGKYYVIATDMKSDMGWNSNHAMVIFESDNLITWKDEKIIDIKAKACYEATNRTWAPQVIYDEEVGKYMVYWSHCLETSWETYLVYAYLNDDFTDIGEIKTLYKPTSGGNAIDGDIIYENNKYYLYYKDEDKHNICYVYSDKLTGPYVEPQDNVVSKTSKDVEGSCMYKLNGTDTYLMIMDAYSDKKYYMQATTKDSMTDFTMVRTWDYKFPKNIRHASVLELTKEEFNTLRSWNTSVGIWMKE